MGKINTKLEFLYIAVSPIITVAVEFQEMAFTVPIFSEGFGLNNYNQF